MAVTNTGSWIDSVTEANPGYRALFDQEMQRLIPAEWMAAAMEFESNGAEEVYEWLNDLPEMQAFTGSMPYHDMKAEGFTLKNTRYATGIKLSRDVYDDDKAGVIKARITSLANAAARHKGKLVLKQFTTAFSDAGYDGVSLCNANHPTKTTVVSNTTGNSLSGANYNTAMAAFQNFTNYHDEPLGFSPTHLMYGPGLRATALSILFAEQISDGTTTVSNINNDGSVKPFMNPFLTGAYAAHWFLLDLSDQMKPVICQTRHEIELTDIVDSELQEVRFNATGRHAVGPGLWQKVYGSNA